MISRICAALFALLVLTTSSLATAEPPAGAVSETPAPPCKNGAADCKPWERDWSNTRLQPGSIVTDQGTIFLPQPHPIQNFLYNWQTLITGGLAILAALIGGGMAYRAGVIQANATRKAADQQIFAIKSALQAESVLRLMDKFDSELFLGKRKIAATACLAHLEGKNPGAEVEDILDFFDDVAFLVKRDAIDSEMMWHPFYHWVRLYFQASEQHIIARTKEEAAVWNYLRWVYPRLNELEKAKSPSTYKEKLDDAELRERLEEELL